MTQTPNVGLKKIDGSENWRNVFDYHNDSMDLADEAIAGVRAGLTYVENGDTIAANADYTEGKFICWKGEIYRVKATINTTVTSANWTTYLDKMDGIGGALSQINGDLATLNSNLASMGKMCKLKNSSSGTSYSFTIPTDVYSGATRQFAFLTYAIDGASYVVIGLVLTDTGTQIASYTIHSTGNTRTLTITRDANVINISASDTVWGGITLFYIG